MLDDIECSNNLTSIKQKLVSKMEVVTATVAWLYASDFPDFKSVLEDLPSSEAFTAGCYAFANYIYCETA